MYLFCSQEIIMTGVYFFDQSHATVCKCSPGGHDSWSPQFSIHFLIDHTLLAPHILVSEAKIFLFDWFGSSWELCNWNFHPLVRQDPDSVILIHLTTLKRVIYIRMCPVWSLGCSIKRMCVCLIYVQVFTSELVFKLTLPHHLSICVSTGRCLVCMCQYSADPANPYLWHCD